MLNKTGLMIALLLAAGAAHAGVQQVIETVPSTDDTNSTVYVSSAVNPTNIAISASVITQVDATLNSALLTALGATYKRALVIIQNTGTTIVNLGFAASGWDVTTAGWVLNPGDTWTFQIGKGVNLYALSVTSAGQLTVGGVGYK